VRPLQYVIGLDGGGTKTAAELCDAAGGVLTSAIGGPSNFQVIGVEQSAKTILDLVETCCHSVGCTIGQLESIVAGLTGAGRPGDQARMAEAIKAESARRGSPCKDVRVESDARIALEGAFGGQPGIIVIAGTGSIVFGKDAAGIVHRSGGWGRIVGDDGSGFAIGRDAFRAVFAAIDRRGPATALSKKLQKNAGLADSDAIITALYKEGFDVASIAPMVMEAAKGGDRVARIVLRRSADDLVGLIAPVVRKLHASSLKRSPFPLAFLGSLLTNKNYYSDRVRSLLRTELPSVRIQAPEAPPVHGAVLIALDGIRS